MTDIVLSIAEKFSRFPAGRYPKDGPYNGERFRRELLIPELTKAEKSGDRVVVVLDGVLGYSSSFLEEVFGGLVREQLFPKETIRKILKIKAETSTYNPAEIDAVKYLNDEMGRH